MTSSTLSWRAQGAQEPRAPFSDLADVPESSDTYSCPTFSLHHTYMFKIGDSEKENNLLNVTQQVDWLVKTTEEI